MSCELGELLATESPESSGLLHYELQARIRDVAAGAITLREALDSDALLDEAQRRVAAYADRLVLVTGSGRHTDVAAIGDITKRFEGQPVALFVDYVQKMPHYPPIAREGERVGRVIEGLKQLALDQQLVVVAIAAADQEGLDARRLHLRHFRGSTALAYEADSIVVLNDKLAVVSRAHVAHSPQRAEEFVNARSSSRSRRTATAARTSTSSSSRTSPTTASTLVVAGWPNACGPKGPSNSDRCL